MFFSSPLALYLFFSKFWYLKFNLTSILVSSNNKGVNRAFRHTGLGATVLVLLVFPSRWSCTHLVFMKWLFQEEFNLFLRRCRSCLFHSVEGFCCFWKSVITVTAPVKIFGNNQIQPTINLSWFFSAAFCSLLRERDYILMHLVSCDFDCTSFWFFPRYFLSVPDLR